MSNNVYAKFLENGKDIIFHIGNTPLRFKRARSNGGMTSPTAVSVVNALNRMLTWVKQNRAPYESETDTDYRYIIGHLFELAKSLQTDTIQKRCSYMLENSKELYGEKLSAHAVKKKYFTNVLNRFAKDERIIDIIDRYTHAVAVDNIQGGDQEEARLASYDIYTFSMLFTFSRIFYISYLTVMDAGDYVSMISDVIFDTSQGMEEFPNGLSDIILRNTIMKYYPESIGAIRKNFFDKVAFDYLSPYIDSKKLSDKTIIDKFGIVGVNMPYLYQKVIYEMFNGIHRIVPSLSIEAQKASRLARKDDEDKNDERDDFDVDSDMDPAERKFYFMKIAKYLSATLNQILQNTLTNFKPSYSMRVEGADLNAEKDVFDARINENKENYEYMISIRDEAVKEAVSLTDNGTIAMSKNFHIQKHNLGKFLISLYLNMRYSISEPVNIMTMSDYKAMVIHIFDLIHKDYENLALALFGKVYSSVNNAQVTLADFGGTIPTFIAANVDGCLSSITHIVEKKYLYELKVKVGNTMQNKSKPVEIRDEFIDFLSNAHKYFKPKPTISEDLDFSNVNYDEDWSSFDINKYF